MTQAFALRGDYAARSDRRPDAAKRSSRLKAATAAAHAELDAVLTSAQMFASLDRYGRFLDVQHAFHADVDPLYGDEALARVLPGLAERRRLPLIAQDLADVALGGGLAAPACSDGPAEDPAAALGWLYVAEGSTLGAAFLLKEAAGLGLSERYGARHLAPAPEGRGLSWRTFTAALDAAPLDEAGDARAIEGAQAAFARVQSLVARAFG